MPVLPVVSGIPGFRAAQTATPRIVFSGSPQTYYLTGGRLIDGSKSRDPLNTGNLDVLRPGLLMGMITASKRFAPSILGVTTVAFTSGGTSITVGLPTAVELVRRVGASGTFTLIGPPSAAGTVAATVTTYSAVNVTTGVITVTDPAANFIAGSFIAPTDGSETILSMIPDEDPTGIKVTDSDGSDLTQVQFPLVPVQGGVLTASILNWPTDTSLITRVVAQLNAAAGGKFVFDHPYQ